MPRTLGVIWRASVLNGKKRKIVDPTVASSKSSLALPRFRDGAMACHPHPGTPC